MTQTWSWQNVVAWWPGSTHHAFILAHSSVGRRLQAGAVHDGWLLGKLINKVFYKILPIQPWCYNRQLTVAIPSGAGSSPCFPSCRAQRKRATVRIHMRAHSVVEWAMGLLKGIWRCLDASGGRLLYTHPKVGQIIRVWAALHMSHRFGPLWAEEAAALLHTSPILSDLCSLLSLTLCPNPLWRKLISITCIHHLIILVTTQSSWPKVSGGSAKIKWFVANMDCFMWHHWCRGLRIWNLLIPRLFLTLSLFRFCLGKWDGRVIKFIRLAAIISIVYKLQTGIFLTESKALWDIKRQRSERRVGGDREVEERSMFSLFQWILSQHVSTGNLLKEVLLRSVWEACCVDFCQLVRVFQLLSFFLFCVSCFLLSSACLLSRLMHKIWQFEVPWAACINGEKQH